MVLLVAMMITILNIVMMKIITTLNPKPKTLNRVLCPHDPREGWNGNLVKSWLRV